MQPAIIVEAPDELGSSLFKYKWRNEPQPLLNEDIRDLSEGENKESGGKRTVSQIWIIKETQNLGNDNHLSLSFCTFPS